MEIKAGRELFISSHLRSEVSRLVLGSPSAVIPAEATVQQKAAQPHFG